jgi:hypothetical protein
VAHNIDPYLKTWAVQVPIHQVFGERDWDGRLVPLKNPVKARTVEDTIRAVVQAHARLGGGESRMDTFGGIYFRIQQQIKSYHKVDNPPPRVNPNPITIIVYIVSSAFGRECNEEDLAIVDMITIAFFFLLWPGEYTGTTADDTLFRLEDVALYIRDRRLDFMTASFVELDAATSVSYTFTTQKNGTRDEKLVQGLSGDSKCCPVTATARRIKYHRAKNSKQTVSIPSYYRAHRRTNIRAKDITDTLQHTINMNLHHTGIHANEISARSLRAGGAMAMICSKIDLNNIRMMGRWHSDAMMRYLHVQAQPIIERYAAKMFNNGTYTFQPYKTVPIIDNYAEE